MALVVSGPLVIQTSSSTQQPQVDTFGNLKKCAARIVNGENQSKILEIAGEGINRCIDDTNMRHLLRLGSKQATAVALSSGDNTYATASDFYAVRAVQLLNSSSQVVSNLEYIPWGPFNKLVESQTDSFAPLKWTAHNTFDDDQIIVWPTPDASAAATYTLRITYYTRISRLSADSDILDAPREFGEVLCTYAEWHLLDKRRGRDSGHKDRKYAEYRDKLNAFVRSDERHAEDGLSWQIAYEDDPVGKPIDPNSFW